MLSVIFVAHNDNNSLESVHFIFWNSECHASFRSIQFGCVGIESTELQSLCVNSNQQSQPQHHQNGWNLTWNHYMEAAPPRKEIPFCKSFLLVPVVFAVRTSNCLLYNCLLYISFVFLVVETKKIQRATRTWNDLCEGFFGLFLRPNVMWNHREKPDGFQDQRLSAVSWSGMGGWRSGIRLVGWNWRLVCPPRNWHFHPWK